MFSSFFLLSLAAVGSTSSISSPLSYTCVQKTVPIHVETQTTKFNIVAPANQTALTGLFTELTTETFNSTAAFVVGKTNLSKTYDIWTELCVPHNFSANGTVEFAVHGINFDHSYWNFGGKGSKYNYVEAAVKSGHAILIYDRLGQGGSSKPDGLTEVQLSTQVEIAAGLVAYLRRGVDSHNFGKVVGVGHSFGSVQLLALATRHGNLVDAAVLTGFSGTGAHIPKAIAAFGVTRDSSVVRNGVVDKAYFRTEGKYNDQTAFFFYPNFDYAVLQQARNLKPTFTLGEALTLGEGVAIAPNFTGPVHLVSGEKDYIYCGGDCLQPIEAGSSTNLIDAASQLFPAASNFSTFIPLRTSHGLNLNLNAQSSYAEIQAWIAHAL